jgi:hypothetical protein
MRVRLQQDETLWGKLMLLDEGFSRDMCLLRQPQIILERLMSLIWSLLFKKNSLARG